MNILRPLSPHLPIYKPQLTSTFPISHRISGASLTTIVLCFSLNCMKIGLICFTSKNFYQFLFYSKKLILISVAITALALSYHLYNGLCHLLTESGGVPLNVWNRELTRKTPPFLPRFCLIGSIMGIITLFASVVMLYFPGGMVDKLWFFSLFGSGGALFAMFKAETLPEQMLGWGAFNVSSLFTFLLLDRLPFAVVFFLWYFVFLFIYFLLDNKGKFSTFSRVVFFTTNMGTYIVCLCLASLTKNMLGHALAVCLMVFFFFVFDSFRYIPRKPFFFIKTTLTLGVAAFFALLAPLHLPGGGDPIIFLLLPFKGAAALFAAFRAKTLPEQIVGWGAFNGSLLLILAVLKKPDYFYFLLLQLLFVKVFLLILFWIDKKKLEILLKKEFSGIFLSNVALSVFLFVLAVKETDSLLYEHGVALSSLMLFIYLFKFSGEILRLFFLDGEPYDGKLSR